MDIRDTEQLRSAAVHAHTGYSLDPPLRKPEWSVGPEGLRNFWCSLFRWKIPLFHTNPAKKTNPEGLR